MSTPTPHRRPQVTVENAVLARPARIVVLAGPRFGHTFPVSVETVLGRAADAGITLDHPGVSRRHARLTLDAAGAHSLEDLSSRNGTMVNGIAITKTALTFGDRIQLGSDCVLLFTHADPGEEKLEQLRRMETVGRLSAGIAHDFNNLLHVIRASLDHVAQVARQEGPLGQESAEIIADGISAMESAASLTRRLLTLSRGATHQRTIVAVDEVVRESVQMCRRLLPPSITLRVEIAPSLRTLADGAELQQAVVNLCLNARDAMPDGGTLSVRASPTTDSAGQPSIAIEVSDTGLGMNEHTRRRIFDPFFTTKGAAGGTGLGLAGALAMAQRHGGTIEVESELQRGSTFRVLIPCVQRPRGDKPTFAAEEQTTTTKVLSNAHRTVLLVEDEPLVRRAITRQLGTMDCTVHAATDIEDAVGRLTVHAADIDLAILDLHLGAESSIALIPRLRAVSPDLAIIVLSGQMSLEEELELRALEVDHLLSKPCSNPTLHAILKRTRARRIVSLRSV